MTYHHKKQLIQQLQNKKFCSKSIVSIHREPYTLLRSVTSKMVIANHAWPCFLHSLSSFAEHIAQTPLQGLIPWAVGGRRLSWSTEVFQRTPRLHQTHLLWEPSSHMGNGCLFSGEASSLDAFSSYPQLRGCPASALSDNRLTRGHSVPFLSY